MTLDAETVAPWLNRLPFVRWDRVVVAPVDVEGADEPDEALEQMVAYGWIDRPVGRADFVELTFGTWTDEVGYSTSSAARTVEIAEILYGAGGEHYECQRVEDYFGDLVANKVAL